MALSSSGIQRAVARVLVDPQFLFRFEREPAGVCRSAVRVTDLELASRLSFFLWSSIPDDALMADARRGALKEPAVLSGRCGECSRIRVPTRSSPTSPGSGCYLRELKNARPDSPDFDANLRQSFAA